MVAECITLLLILRETVFFIFTGKLTHWSGAENEVNLRFFDKIIWLMEFSEMLHISMVLFAERLRFPVTFLCLTKYRLILLISVTIYSHVAVLQIARSLVRSQLDSLEFFIDIILPIALWPWSRLNL